MVLTAQESWGCAGDVFAFRCVFTLVDNATGAASMAAEDAHRSGGFARVAPHSEKQQAAAAAAGGAGAEVACDVPTATMAPGDYEVK